MLDRCAVAHGVIRTRFIHLGVINNAIGDVLILKVSRKLVGKGTLRRIELAFLEDLQTRAALINRIAPRIRLLIVQIIGEHVAAHVGLELALVERDGPCDVGRRAIAVARLANHVVTKGAGGSRNRAVLTIVGTAPLPRRHVL